MEENQGKRCPRCGRELLFQDTVCPFCGADTTDFAWEETPAGSPGEAKQRTEPRPLKKRVRSLRQNLYSVVVMLLVMLILGGVSNLQQDLRRRNQYREQREELASAPTEVMDSRAEMHAAMEALAEQDAQAPWRDPEKLLAEHPELSDKEKKDLEAICRHKLTQGSSRKECMEFLALRECTPEEAMRILGICQADEKIQATEAAMMLLSRNAYSRKEARQELMDDGFSWENAHYGLENCGADWEMQTLLAARSYIYNVDTSEETLVRMLLENGHDPEAVMAALENLNADWNQEAVRKGKRWVEDHFKNRKELMRYLESSGFTAEQSQYAVNEICGEK